LVLTSCFVHHIQNPPAYKIKSHLKMFTVLKKREHFKGFAHAQSTPQDVYFILMSKINKHLHAFI